VMCTVNPAQGSDGQKPGKFTRALGLTVFAKQGAQVTTITIMPMDMPWCSHGVCRMGTLSLSILWLATLIDM